MTAMPTLPTMARAAAVRACVPSATTAPGTQAAAQVKSIGAQIDELYELRNRGILTPDELETKTAALLKRTR